MNDISPLPSPKPLDVAAPAPTASPIISNKVKLSDLIARYKVRKYQCMKNILL
jgi:hypothetical protein